MNFNLNSVKTLSCKAYMKLKKISPELALAGGIACGIGAVVVGCIASRKVNDIVEETNNQLNDIQVRYEEATHQNSNRLVNNIKRESFIVYRNAAWKFTKLYAPTVGLTMASIGLILTSHGILNKRYVGVSAAYSALDGAFKDYRKRVSDALGEDAERILAAGGKAEKNIKVVDEEGNVETKKNSNIVIQNHKESPYEFDYNRFTARGSWEPNADYIEMRLRNTQNYFNEWCTPPPDCGRRNY